MSKRALCFSLLKSCSPPNDIISLLALGSKSLPISALELNPEMRSTAAFVCAFVHSLCRLILIDNVAFVLT